MGGAALRGRGRRLAAALFSGNCVAGWDHTDRDSVPEAATDPCTNTLRGEVAGAPQLFLIASLAVPCNLQPFRGVAGLSARQSSFACGTAPLLRTAAAKARRSATQTNAKVSLGSMPDRRPAAARLGDQKGRPLPSITARQGHDNPWLQTPLDHALLNGRSCAFMSTTPHRSWATRLRSS